MPKPRYNIVFAILVDCPVAGETPYIYEVVMSELNQEEREDSFADACAAIAILTIVVSTVVYWLAGMPS